MYRFVAKKPNPNKKRSRQACNECRRRRVRCDVDCKTPAPCNNCTLDGIECKVDEIKPRAERRSAKVAAPAEVLTTDKPQKATESIAAVSGAGVVDRRGKDGPINTVPRQIWPATSSKPPSVGLASLASLQTLTISGVNVVLPNFIKPLEGLCPAEIDFLKAMKCFSFPSRDFELVIVQRFGEYVYPLLPALNLDEFIAAFMGKTQTKISILLYYALLGAGLAAVDLSLIRQYEYPSKADARNDFCSRAKALLSLNAETDCFILCQAALLLMSWAHDADRKDAYYWSGLAITYGHTIRLQESLTVDMPASPSRNLKRRVWKTTLVKEIDSCLAMGRPPRLVASELPETTLYDYTEHDNMGCYEGLSEFDKMRNDSRIVSALESASNEKEKLSMLILKLLQLIHTPKENTETIESRRTKIWQLDARLQDWKNCLPSKLWVLNLTQSEDTSIDKRLKLTAAIMNSSFLMATILLHKPEVPARKWIATIENHTTWNVDEETHHCRAHMESMRMAADDVANIYAKLRFSGLTEMIPPVGVATLCAAVGVYLLDMRSSVESLRERSLDRMKICVDVLREAGRINYAAEELFNLVESSVSAVESSLPKVRFTSGPGNWNEVAIAESPFISQNSHLARGNISLPDLTAWADAPGLDATWFTLAPFDADYLPEGIPGSENYIENLELRR